METATSIQGPRLSGFFDRETTPGIKGIALICMFIHHLFTFPEWYVAGISYPGLAVFARLFQEPFRICVPVFAFLTGYGYQFVRRADYRYSLRKITDVLLGYWAVYLPLLVIAKATGNYVLDIRAIVLELFGLKRPVMALCWYVYFYIAAMLLLPLLPCKTVGQGVLFGVALPVFSQVFLLQIVDSLTLREVITEVCGWLPCVTMGLICARFSLFERLDRGLRERISPAPLRTLVVLAMMLAAFLGRHFVQCLTLHFTGPGESVVTVQVWLDILYAPVFVYGAGKLVRRIGVLSLPLKQLGKYSLLMWFLHCIFFNVCKELFQPILYLPGNPVLVLLWGLFLCYGVARVINLPLKWVLKQKNRLLFPEREV